MIQNNSSKASSSIQCSFCGQNDNETHQCRADIFRLINRLGNHKKDSAFSEIENLVFQGGGVKGIAYVGAFKALFDEHKIYDQIKRVAGSSAGAIAALYASLGLSTKEIGDFLETNLLDKLDDQPTVTVEKTEFPIRLVFDKLLESYGEYTKKDVIDLVADVISGLLLTNFQWKGSIASFFASERFAELIANYVFLAPSSINNKTIAQRVYELEQEIILEEMKMDNVKMIREIDINKLEELEKVTWWPWPDEKPTLDKKQYFHAALSDLIQQTFITANPKFSDGWFSADKIKDDLIIEPIRQAYQRINQIELFNKDLTFKDLASVTSEGKPAFKKLYVTAFNTATGRTDVFSVDHTPNVVVADAVRASMSIPIFFKAVKIRERVGDSLAPRQIFTSLNESKDILYMDGGIMDNFAMWIFDDLQYCVGESFTQQWVPQQKIPMRNPFTLGVKLISTEQRKLYLNPYVDQENLKQKIIQLPEDPTPLKLIARALFSDTQENDHIHHGDASRTIYVDNLGVTAISFKLKPEEIKDFERSGELGVRQYLNYFRWNKLSSIGEKYIAIQRFGDLVSEKAIYEN